MSEAISTPTLEMLAEQASERGASLGEQDALKGQYMDERDVPKYLSDINLLYMVFVYEEGDDEEIYTDYIRSEFMLAYTFAFFKDRYTTTTEGISNG